MRLIGLVIALGVIGWVLYQAAGGGDSESAIPEGYQQSMEKASGVEKTVQDAAQKQLEDLDSRNL